MLPVGKQERVDYPEVNLSFLRRKVKYKLLYRPPAAIVPTTPTLKETLYLAKTILSRYMEGVRQRRGIRIFPCFRLSFRCQLRHYLLHRSNRGISLEQKEKERIQKAARIAKLQMSRERSAAAF
eukprot:scaffold18138_cov128-Cylindrotheca_fusiformis.AAC.11